MAPDLHPELHPLVFLLGTWEGGGEGGYPTVEPFRYRERMVFEHVGDPFFLLSVESWSLDGDEPLHFERGFLRPGASPGSIELVLAHPIGLTEISEGRIDGSMLELRSTAIDRATTGDPVTKIERRYRVDGDTLRYELDMEMEETPMTRHLDGELHRISG